MNANPKEVMTWVLVVAVPVGAAVVLAGLLHFMSNEALTEIVKAHFPAVVGLPLAAIFAAFIVVALQQTAGPVKFEGLGFKFEGSAGQVVLWVFCFLAIAVAIRLLWSTGT